MGRFDFTVSDDFIKTLGRLSQVDKVAPMMINETLPTVSSYIKSGFESAGHPYSDGDLVRSIKEKPATEDKNGGWRGISRPTGKDDRGVRNMEKLAYYEYGTSKQPARPIMDKIRNDVQGPAEENMRKVFEREMKL